MWTTKDHTELFPQPEKGKDTVKEYAIYLHAVGQGARDSDGGAAVKQSFVYYLSVSVTSCLYFAVNEPWLFLRSFVAFPLKMNGSSLLTQTRRAVVVYKRVVWPSSLTQ